ncbi:hypothetical protein H1S04_10850 [Paracoccus sp. S1E-3]|nr:hypothetical protein [Paracoccus sp. S1E-3]MBA4491258.1 hypothetical protein [Paracoccus sp. S1E-3]
MTIRFCLLLLVAGAGAAGAGPWPREKGTAFLSFSEEGDREGNSYAGLYGEYGMNARDTLGFEIGRSSADETSAMIWWQRALDRGAGPDRITISTGMGVLQRDDELVPLAQIGVSWGRGWDSLPLLRGIRGGGWLAVDARLKVAAQMKDQAELAKLAGQNAGLLSYVTPDVTAKVDATLGWHATSSMMLVNQLRLEHRDDIGFSGKLAATLVRDLVGPAKGEMGMVLPLWGDGEQAVKLAVWFAF